jgi:excisionase family DNA binding protein
VIYFGTKRNRRRGVVEKLYTVKEVLEMLRISRTTLYRHIDNRLLKPLKLGGKVLFAESELDRLLQRAKGEENQIEGGNQKVLQNSVKSLNPDEARRLDLAKAARVARAQRVKKKK